MQNTLGSATQRREAVIVNIDSWIIDNSKDIDNDYFNFCLVHGLNAWGRVTHICVGKLNTIDSDNGLRNGVHFVLASMWYVCVKHGQYWSVSFICAGFGYFATLKVSFRLVLTVESEPNIVGWTVQQRILGVSGNRNAVLWNENIVFPAFWQSCDCWWFNFTMPTFYLSEVNWSARSEIFGP